MKKNIIASVVLGCVIGIPFSVFAVTHQSSNKMPQELVQQDLQVEQTQVVEVEEPEHYVPDDTYADGMWNEQYTEEDVMLLASCVYAEAGSGTQVEQRGVASVILNRVASSNYPNTIREVIYQKRPTLQYECTINGTLDKYKEIYNGGDYNESDLNSLESAFENTQYVLSQGSQLPSDVVFQAEFRQGSGVYEKVGRTYFCYE